MVEDLSKFHHPVSTFLGHPFTKNEEPQYRISQDQIDFYHANGYLSGVRVLTDHQIDQLCAELAELVDPSHPGNSLFYEFHTNESPDPSRVLFHALGAWRISPGFHDVLWHPAHLVPASQLLGGAVRFWHDQLFCKPVRHGGVVAWHQDYSYWTRTIPMNHLTCWIGLDDSTVDNGCIHYIPGSHRWPLLPITGLAGDMTAIHSVLSEEQMGQFKPVAVELKKGECTFHHPLMVHGSYENRTDIPRRALVVNVFIDGTCSDKEEPLLSRVPAIPRGQRMDGQFFPLLYQP